jgi:lysine biosynthesis protein LysW
MAQIITPCPTCEEEITLPEGTIAAELITCDECDSMFEVVEGENGLELTDAPEVEEDWGE